MDYKQIFSQFKERYIKAGESFSFSLFPVLFKELKDLGIGADAIQAQFIEDFHKTLLAGEKTSVLLYSLKYLEYYRAAMLPLTSSAGIIIQKPAVETKTETAIIAISQPVVSVESDEHYMPPEEDEGDPFFTPESERINLKPEDCADMQVDWDFAERIGAVGFKK